MNDLVTIAAGHGKAARLRAGQSVKLVNTHGTQVVDCWAFSAYDLNEFMCMETTRSGTMHLNPVVGDTFLTTLRRPILTLVEDTSPGIHDTFCAACDRQRYELLGAEGYHRNCLDNLFEGMAELGVTLPVPVRASFNVFMNIEVQDNKIDLVSHPTDCRPGDYIVLRAEMDCFVAFSACPQDILNINEKGLRDAHFTILD